MSGAPGVLFEDSFEIRKMEDKKFDRVSRFVCESDDWSMTMTIDINTEIYRLEEGKKIKVVIASTLNVDGSPCDDVFDATVLDGTRPTLMDDFEYVVYGRVFKYNRPKEGAGADGKGGSVEIIASFGGLLMMLKGDPRHIKNISNDQKIYLLIRKMGA